MAPPSLLRRLPARPTCLILLVAAGNVAAWTVAATVLHLHPRLISPAALSYVLGLRHALDADHIAAIDLTTRRLIASGRRPAAVGAFFSLGHSAVVVATCVAVAATSGALRDRFEAFRRVGAIVGSAVSAAFLILLCGGNGWVLCRLVRRLRALLAEEREMEGQGEGREQGREQQQDPGDGLGLDGPGLMTAVFRQTFRLVDRSWKMLPLGVLFGLGFDTSSEIAVLGIASIQAVQGTTIWLILIFPMLFAAGMCLLDTIDGALMATLYGSKAFARDPVAILYYSIVLTAITITVSAFIGVIQLLSLVQAAAGPEGRFWDGVGAVGDRFDVIGGSVCGLFALVAAVSAAAYRPWRRRMERRRFGERLGGGQSGGLDGEGQAGRTDGEGQAGGSDREAAARGRPEGEGAQSGGSDGGGGVGEAEGGQSRGPHGEEGAP